MSSDHRSVRRREHIRHVEKRLPQWQARLIDSVNSDGVVLAELKGDPRAAIRRPSDGMAPIFALHVREAVTVRCEKVSLDAEAGDEAAVRWHAFLSCPFDVNGVEKQDMIRSAGGGKRIDKRALSSLQ
jgi:hypothetical protein